MKQAHAIAVLAVAVLGSPVFGQQDRTLTCDDNNWGGNQQRACEIREQTMAYGGSLTVDGGQNGGVAIKGWTRADIQVRAKVEARAATEGDAKGMLGRIRVITDAGSIASDGPSTEGRQQWSVSYEVFVPQDANLKISTHNGGVSVQDFRGTAEFSAVNGGVHLSRVNGSIHGKTTNGGVHIALAGSRWEGSGLDVTTTNGGVHLEVPSNYSAHLEASTTNGGVHNAAAMTVSGKIGKQVSANLGAGGAPIRVITTNGGVHINQI